MSRTIDEKVVEMRFDNRDFEKNVETSMSTLDKLKAKLNFDGASKGFEEISRASDKVDFSEMGGALDTIKVKFGALETMAITALANITNRAVDAGIELVKSLSVDNISAGWDKFGKKTTSVGTLIAQGFSQEEVTKELEKLNWFTDETSYDFVSMVDNIGKFTASGKGLHESVEAMEGIANWAALSGQNAQTASRAMYQLSQAMSSGVMRKQDWVSVSTANMDTAEFRKMALEAAEALGTVKKTEDGLYKSLVATKETDPFSAETKFIDSLTTGAWFTSDVMMEVFGRYNKATNQIHDYIKEQEELGRYLTANEAMDEMVKNGIALDEFALKAFKAGQEARTFADVLNSVKDAVSTGWMNTFENIFGDYSEAKVLWTDLANELYEVFAEGGNARNELLEAWKAIDEETGLGGRDFLFNKDEEKGPIGALWNIIYAIKELIQPIKDAFHEIFPPMEAERLKKITERIRDFTAKLRISDETAEKLKNTFKGIFSVLDILKQVFSAVWRSIRPLFGGITKLRNKILETSSSIGESLVSVKDYLKENDIFYKSFQKIVFIIGAVINAIKNFAKEIKERLHIPDFKTIKDSFKGLIETFKTKLSSPGVDETSESLLRLSTILEAIKNTLKKVKEGFLNALEKIGDKIREIKFVDIFSKLLSGLKTIFGGVIRGLTNLFHKLFDAIGSGGLQGFIDTINGFITSGIGIAFIGFIRKITGAVENAGGIFSNIKGIFADVRNVLSTYQKQIQAKTLLKIAIAVGILSLSLIALASVDVDKMNNALTAITVLIGELVGSLYLINKMSGKSKPKGTGVLIGLAFSVLILASAIKKIASIDSKGLTNGLLAITALISLMIISVEALSNDEKKFVQGAMTMIAMALALRIVVSSLKSLAKLSWESLGKGLLGVLALMSMMVIAIKVLTTNEKKFIKGAMAMVVMALALRIVVSSLKSLAKLSWENLKKGLLGVLALMSMMVIAIKVLTTNEKKFIKGAMAMVVIGIALRIVVSSLKSLAKLSWEDLGKGLLGVLALMSMMVIAIKVLTTNEKKFLKGATAMVIMAFALKLLTSVLIKLGSMSWEEIGKGLLALAGIFVVVGISAAVLKNLTGTILKLSAAFIVLGIGIIAIGLGLMAIGTGLTMLSIGITALAGSLSAGATAIVAGLSVIFTGIVELIPAVATAIAKGIIKFIVTLSEGIDAIASALLPMLISLIKIFDDALPYLIRTVIKLVKETLRAIAKNIGSIVDSLLKIIISVINALANRMPDIIIAVFNLIASIFNAIIDILKKVDPKIFLNILKSIAIIGAIMLAATLLKNIAASAMAGIAVVALFVAELALLIAAFGALSQIPGLKWLINEGGEFLEAIGNAIGRAIGGLVGGFMGAAANGLMKIVEVMKSFIFGILEFFDGLALIPSSALESALLLAEIMLIFAGAELIDGIAKFIGGGNAGSMAKFAEELSAMAPALVDFANQVKGINGDDLKVASEAGLMLAQMAGALPRTGGKLQELIGEVKTLTQFAEELRDFAPAIVEYSRVVAEGNIDQDAVEASVNAAQMVADFAETLPRTGGILQDLIGEVKNLKDFAEELKAFAPAIVDYSKVVSEGGIDQDAVEASTKAAQMIVDFANELPREGGWLQGFIGEKKNLKTFADEMIDFAPKFVEYSNIVKDVDANIVDTSTNLAKAIVEIAERIGKIDTSWGKGIDFDDFGDMLEDFGESMVAYWDSVKNITSFDVIKRSADASDGLVKIAERLGKIDVENDKFEDFIDSLPNYGENLKKYYDHIKDISDFGKITDSAVSASAFSDIVTAVNKIEFKDNSASFATAFDGLPIFGKNLFFYARAIKGITSDQFANVNASITGAKGLAQVAAALSLIESPDLSIIKFGDGIKSFGENFAGYAQAISGLTEGNFENVTKSIEAAKSFADIIKAVSEVSGVQIVSSEFANSLPDFGQKMHAFYFNLIGGHSNFGFDGYKSVNAANTALTLAQAFKEISSENIDGDNLVLFGDGLGKVGEGLFHFYEKIYFIPEDGQGRIETAVKNLSDIVDLMVTMKQNLAAFSSDTTTLSVLSDWMSQFASNYASFYQGVYSFIDGTTGKNSVIDNSRVGSVIENLEALVNIGSKVTDDNVKKLTYIGIGLGNLYTGASNLFSWMSSEGKFNVDYIQKKLAPCIAALATSFVSLESVDTDKLTAFSESFKELGSNALSKFVASFSGLTDSGMFKKAANAAYQKIIDALNGVIKEREDGAVTGGLAVNSFKKLGRKSAEYFADGFIDALGKKADAMAKAAYRLGEAVKKGFATDSLEERSPSRASARSAEYYVAGFVNKLESLRGTVYESSSNLGNSANNGLSDSIRKISGIISGEIDTQPTIRPVLDLSDVESGSRAINTMMLGDRTINLARGNAASINDMYEYNNNITVKNDDVVGAITSLREDVNGLSIKMERMRVVMDTGALVGAMAGPMDNALGKRMIYKGRGG